jgi:hypothetical protein
MIFGATSWVPLEIGMGMQVHEHQSRETIEIVRVLSSSMSLLTSPLFTVLIPQTTAALSLPLTPEQNFAHPALVLARTLSTEQPWRTDTVYLVM